MTRMNHNRCLAFLAAGMIVLAFLGCRGDGSAVVSGGRPTDKPPGFPPPPACGFRRPDRLSIRHRRKQRHLSLDAGRPAAADGRSGQRRVPPAGPPTGRFHRFHLQPRRILPDLCDERRRDECPPGDERPRRGDRAGLASRREKNRLYNPTKTGRRPVHRLWTADLVSGPSRPFFRILTVRPPCPTFLRPSRCWPLPGSGRSAGTPSWPTCARVKSGP